MHLAALSLLSALVQAIPLEGGEFHAELNEPVDTQACRASALLQVGRSYAASGSESSAEISKADAEEPQLDSLDGLLAPLDEAGFRRVVTLGDIDQVNQFTRRTGISMGLPVSGPNSVSHVVTHYHNMAELPNNFNDLQQDIQMAAGGIIPSSAQRVREFEEFNSEPDSTEPLNQRRSMPDTASQPSGQFMSDERLDTGKLERPAESSMPESAPQLPSQPMGNSASQRMEEPDRGQAHSLQRPEESELSSNAYRPQSSNPPRDQQSSSFIAHYGSMIAGTAADMNTGLGANAQLDQEGYSTILQLRNKHELETFVRRTIDDLGLAVIDGSGFKDFVASIASKKALSSFGNVKGKILNTLGTPRAWVADTSQAILLQKGSDAPLSEEGYAAIASLRSNREMVSFIDRVIDDMGLTVTNHGGVEGLAPYFSGDKQVGYFKGLESEISKASETPGSWVERI